MLTPADPDPTLQALAAGDLHAIGAQLAAAGLDAQVPAPGMLQVLRRGTGDGDGEVATQARMRLLISVGVHGNETAPVEMMAQVLDTLLQAPYMLVPDLLLVVGNPPAIAAASRFIDADLNRMFTAERGALGAAAEAARADAIMQASAAFFAEATGARWHLDLHSAIRPSRYARFAVIPADAGSATQAPLTQWLGSAGIEAVMFNSQRASTYSAFTARSFGALSCTVELGQVGVLGHNPPDQLMQAREALLRLLQGQPPAASGTQPVRFRVAQEIIKRSDAFRMTLDGTTHNFTDLPPHAVIATDGDVMHRVGAATEYIVFPNPKVLIGQRAGLMVVRDDGADEHAAASGRSDASDRSDPAALQTRQ
jgi:succinylglutamate desuccinylase